MTGGARRLVHRFFPSLIARGPFFILGCGRSGTTALGRCLARHPRVTYLNEPRNLWRTCYPATDIWSAASKDRGGRLVLGREDAGRGANRELRTLFFQETLKTGRPVLVEKLPANNFRLPFLRALYPRARFIHILRNGREVAASIERWTGKAWFGAGDYKWKELARFARVREATLELPGLCDNDYERGLLEWRLSTQAVRGFFENARPGICLEVGYDEFISRPAETVDSVLSFMGLERSREVGEYAAGNIARRSRAVSSDGLSEKEEALAGELLRRTDGKISSPEG